MNNNFSPFPILKSNRLILKPLSIEQAEAIYDYQSKKDNFPYTEMPVYTHISQAESYIKKMNKGVEDNNWIIWSICLAETEDIIGTISIWNFNHVDDIAEFGFGIFPEYRKQGYMAEALNFAIEYGFKVMKLQSIEAYTAHINKPSICLLKKMGFKYVKTFEDDYSNGALMDLYII